MLAIKSLRSSSLIPCEMINLALLTFSSVKNGTHTLRKMWGEYRTALFLN